MPTTVHISTSHFFFPFFNGDIGTFTSHTVLSVSLFIAPHLEITPGPYDHVLILWLKNSPRFLLITLWLTHHLMAPIPPRSPFYNHQMKFDPTGRKSHHFSALFTQSSHIILISRSRNSSLSPTTNRRTFLPSLSFSLTSVLVVGRGRGNARTGYQLHGS